jgi:hypothetical protein
VSCLYPAHSLQAQLVALTALMRRLFNRVEVDIVCHVPRQHLQLKSATFCKPHEPSTPPQKQTSLPKF